jgi:hypothetical protein
MRNPEIAGSNPAPGTPATLIISKGAAMASLHFPFLDINSYYNFLSTTMIVLFVVGLVVIFVYEYEALRRSKT